MPTYSYVCSNQECKGVSDLTAAMRDRDAWVGKECSTCGKGELRRKFVAYNVLNAGLGDII